jgi:hypothetical protein
MEDRKARRRPKRRAQIGSRTTEVENLNRRMSDLGVSDAVVDIAELRSRMLPRQEGDVVEPEETFQTRPDTRQKLRV